MRGLFLAALAALFAGTTATFGADTKGVKVLIITGDEIPVHKWKETVPLMKKLLTKAGHQVDITQTPSKDLTAENLAKYVVFLLNYRNTPKGAKDNPASVWSE